MQDIEVIDMRTVTTGCAKNVTTFLKSLNLIALRLPLPPFYFPKQTFYLSICNPPFKCWTPPKLKFCFNVLRKLSLLLHSKVFLFTRNFDQCFRLIKKLTSISTKRIKPFLDTTQSFLLCVHGPCTLQLLMEQIDSPFCHHLFCWIATKNAFAIHMIVPKVVFIGKCLYTWVHLKPQDPKGFFPVLTPFFSHSTSALLC